MLPAFFLLQAESIHYSLPWSHPAGFILVITARMHNFSVTNNPLFSSSRYQRTAQRSSVEGFVGNDVQYLIWILKYWLPCSRMQSRAESDNQTSLLEEESKSFFISPLVCVKINIQLVYLPNNCTYQPVSDAHGKCFLPEQIHPFKVTIKPSLYLKMALTSKKGEIDTYTFQCMHGWHIEGKKMN